MRCNSIKMYSTIANIYPIIAGTYIIQVQIFQKINLDWIRSAHKFMDGLMDRGSMLYCNNLEK